MRAGDQMRDAAAGAVDVSDQFRDVYRALLPTVFGYARARLREQDAEDVTAEVLAAVLQRMREHPGADVSKGWALVVTRNRIIDRWRREARWAERAELLRRDADDEIHADDNDHVVEALDRLPPEYRAVIVLRYLEGWTSAEIGEMFGRSSRAIDSLSARARKAFATAMGEEGQ